VEHVLAARIRSVDPACHLARVPLVDNCVELHPRVALGKDPNSATLLMVPIPKTLLKVRLFMLPCSYS
jgi:hypothetical protein